MTLLSPAPKSRRPGRRYSALVEFKGEVTIIRDVKAWNREHAAELIEKRRETLFKQNQTPLFQRKTWRLLGIFYGSIYFARE